MAKGSRQASADEIEITKEMIAAGVAALEEARGSFGDAQAVVNVYIAMRALAPIQSPSDHAPN